MPGENFAGFRYSQLDQITPGNVDRLTVAWTLSVGVLRGQEAAPIVADDTIFVITSHPNILYALDLTKPGAPLKWQHEPKPLAAAQGVACQTIAVEAEPAMRSGEPSSVTSIVARPS